MGKVTRRCPRNHRNESFCRLGRNLAVFYREVNNWQGCGAIEGSVICFKYLALPFCIHSAMVDIRRVSPTEIFIDEHEAAQRMRASLGSEETTREGKHTLRPR